MTVWTLTLKKGDITLRGNMYFGSAATDASWNPETPHPAKKIIIPNHETLLIPAKGFKHGDVLQVMATFNWEPSSIPDPRLWPNANQYVGLSVGACLANSHPAYSEFAEGEHHMRTNPNYIKTLARNLPLKNKGHLLGGILPSKQKIGKGQDPNYVLPDNYDNEFDYEVNGHGDLPFHKELDIYGDDPNNYFFTDAIAYRHKEPKKLFSVPGYDRGSTAPYLAYQWVMRFNGNNRLDPSGTHIEMVFGYGDPQFHEEAEI